MIVLYLISPALLVIYSFFASFPLLIHLNPKLFRNLDDINIILFNSFLYIYFTLRLLYNLFYHFAINQRKFSKLITKHLISYVLFLQVCLLLNLPLNHMLLIMCGDIESNPGPLNESKKALSVCHWNLNGISTHSYIKLSMLEAYNALHNYDLICISETFLNSYDLSTDQSLKLKGYELIRADHPSNTKRGGVCIYYKDHLPLKIRNDVSTLNECIVVEIKNQKQKCFVSCLYRSPSQSPDELKIFCDDLEETLFKLNAESPLCSVVLGDFNARCKKWFSNDINNIPGVELDKLTSLTGYKQLIKEATNIEPNKSKTCIDLIFSSQPNLISDSGVHPSLFQTCHHQIIYAKIDLKFYLPPPYEREVWCYDRARIDQINRSILMFDWENAFLHLDANEQVELFNMTLLNIFRNFIPNKMLKCNSKEAPWITKEIKTNLRKKTRLYKKFISNGYNTTDLNNLANQSRHCSELIDSSKKTHFRKLSSKLNDPHLGPKTYWSILNGILGKVKVPIIPPLYINNTFETNFLTKANIFNDYFASQCSLLMNNSTLPNAHFKTNSRLSNIDVNRESIGNIIKDLNPAKAHGWDGISIRMIKMCDKSIVVPLMIIFKKVISSSTYPESWKKGNIVPVHKKESKNLVQNYRPISLLPICSKIFEKLIYNSLFRHLKDNDLLVKSQSGFLPGDSCISQLLIITHDIYEAFDGNTSLETRGIFLDISKAFDRVWHKGLLLKLKNNGIDGLLYLLLENYLLNRKQRVVLNGQSSNWANINAGVPQGSVLGPLLFLIYINDLPEGLESNVKLFADDTSIFSVVNDTNKSCTELNSDLSKINDWAYQWKMSFNPDPNKLAAEVIFSHKIKPDSHPPIYFNNSQVVTRPFTKHLGMVLDSKLNFKQHIDDKICKANRGIGLLKKLNCDLSRKSLLAIYKSFVRPHLDYGDIIYDKPNVQTFIDRIESVQYNAALAITGAIRGTSRERIYNELGLESLEKRRWYRRMCFFWKIVNKFSPSYLVNCLPPIQFSRNPARQNKFSILPKKTDYFSNSFFPYCSHQWNELDPAIKNIQSISLFKKALLQFIRPSAMPVFAVTDYTGLKLLTRLRLNLSHLNEHKFNHNFRDTINPLCSCSLESESVSHFLLHCPFYSIHRKTLFDSVSAIDNSILNLTDINLVNLLLYGNSKLYNNEVNTSILNFTICFLKSSERFDIALF